MLLGVIASEAQTLKDVTIDPSDNGKALSEFLLEKEKENAVDFIADMAALRAFTITNVVEKERLSDYLRNHFSFLVFKYTDKIMFVLDERVAASHALRSDNFLLVDSDTDSIKGTVIDAITGDALPGARIYLPETGRVVASDANGRFEIGVRSGKTIIVDVQYVGYNTTRYVVGYSPSGDESTLMARLLPESRELEGVTITAERIDQNVTARISGVQTLSISTMKTLPAFMGEIDPIRSLTSLPGVSTPGELASGFNVRGGEAGQNLVLQDGAVIYNPSHLFGFFSAFNPDLVSNVTLYKGAGPANFGSRISSVLDVSLRNGNATKHTVSGALGLISSRLTLEGPIVRNKSSYLVGGRISHTNWLLRATDNISLRNSAAQFHDITAKVFHTIDENNFMTVTGYKSHDDFQLATDSIFSWATSNLSLKWDHTFNDVSFGALTVSTSNYFSEVQSVNEIERFRYRNAISNLGLKYDFTRIESETSKLVAGGEANGTLLEPGKLTPEEGSANVVSEDMQDQRSIETAIYLQGDYDVSEKLSVSAGLRYGYYLRLGAERIYIYNYDEMDGRYPSVSDTIFYDRGEVIQRYAGLEPRISLRYLINGSSSIKASYFRGFQYLHLISNTSSTTPQDYWLSSGRYLKPQRGDQYSLGLFKNFKDNRYQFSLEGFYKNIHDAVDFIEGADLTLNPNVEAGLSQGEGLAYGMETMIKKSTGGLTGWVAYTYSRSLRRFGREGHNPMINNGAYYPSAFDQPHRGTLILTYQLSPRSFISGNFNYSTGRPITIPVSKFSYDAYLSVLNYSERNDYRIPDYHRLDLSLTIKDKARSNKRFSSEWVISVFNVYGRKNTYSILFNRYGTASKLSVLGSILPSVHYNFRF